MLECDMRERTDVDIAGLEKELAWTALQRGHCDLKVERFLVAGSRRNLTRFTCRDCGMDADANDRPMPNGIDIGGPLVAMNCRVS